MTDLIIIGAGPAGMTAALYAARAGKSVLVLEKETFGGQITYSPRVENYPGIKQISGNEWASGLVEQILDLGRPDRTGNGHRNTAGRPSLDRGNHGGDPCRPGADPATASATAAWAYPVRRI